MARKTNVTGIPRLSIGTTRNNRGHSILRYTVNHKIEGKIIAKSFYFGARQSQRQAFKNACAYMREHKLIGKINFKKIYADFKHENLV